MGVADVGVVGMGGCVSGTELVRMVGMVILSGGYVISKLGVAISRCVSCSTGCGHL